VETKTCTKCNRDLPLERFYASPTGRGGLYAQCKDCTYVQNEKWRLRNLGKAKETQRKSSLKVQFGITIADYETLFASQGGVCALCGKPETTRRAGVRIRLSVDHDHYTGRVRGLLCNRCNRILGCWADNFAQFRKAAAYLESAEAWRAYHTGPPNWGNLDTAAALAPTLTSV
jgi:hypothetical protein